MGMIKEINDKDLIGEKQIKKRWQEYTGKLYQKKSLNDPDNNNGPSPRARYPGVWSQVGLRKL